MVFLLEQSAQTKKWIKGVFTTLYYIFLSYLFFNYALHHLPKQKFSLPYTFPNPFCQVSSSKDVLLSWASVQNYNITSLLPILHW